MAVSLKGKTLFITGASRGIGLAIALRAACDGANVAIAAKTEKQHDYLPGTIHSAARAVDEAGGRGLAIRMDVRSEEQVRNAVSQAAEHFGGIDICVNNASAMYQARTLETEMKRYDLVHDVVARGSFMVTQACLPHLFKSNNPHVLMFCGPPELRPARLARSLHNSIAKNSAAMCVIGMAEEFRETGVAVNGLRPRTWIGTSAIAFRRGNEGMEHSRKPEIMAEAACAIFRRPSRQCTGRFLCDDEVLYEEGERDFDKYSTIPGNTLYLSGMSPDSDLPPWLSNIVAPRGAMGENAREIILKESGS